VRKQLEGRRVRSALVVALMVLSAACARPNSTQAQLPPPTPISTPTPSPSPTPTAPLQASTPPFHSGEVGVGYAAVALSATGGVQPYSWSISAGALPDGLNLSGDGSVSGTPTSAGSFAFTIQVADIGGSTATVSGKIGIAAALSASIIAACARACQVEAGCVTVCGNFGTISGGVGPYRVTATGYVPPGTTISPNQLAYTGTFSRPVSYWQSTVTVTDALGQAASVSPVFNVFAHIAIAGGSCVGNFPTGCLVQLKITPGTPGGTPSLKISGVICSPNTCNGPAGPGPLPNTLPQGFSATASPIYVTVNFPKGMIDGWFGSFLITLTDQSTCSTGPTRCVSAPATVTVNVVGG